MRPISRAARASTPVFAAALTSLCARPALAAMEGAAIVPAKVRVEGIRPLPEFTWLIPVALDDNGQHVARPPRNSGDFVSLAGTIGFIEIPPGDESACAPMFPLYPFS